VSRASTGRSGLHVSRRTSSRALMRASCSASARDLQPRCQRHLAKCAQSLPRRR
jgi:hypothetical protein